jgi:hypothetical protein
VLLLAKQWETAPGTETEHRISLVQVVEEWMKNFLVDPIQGEHLEDSFLLEGHLRQNTQARHQTEV